MQRITSLCSLLFFLVVLRASASAGSLSQPVVGGTEVKPGEWPDVVAVLGEDGSLCTGTLLAADLVLTAGHCIDGNPIEVIVGSVDLARPDGDRRRVKWSRAYPQWLDRYDVGVVMLENPVQATYRAVAQGCTQHPNFATGLPLQIVGFGLTTKTATDNNTRLHQATVPVIDATCASDPACVPAVAPGGEFTAGGRGADACFGDSGGPAYISTAQGPALMGVVSRGMLTFGDPCIDGGVYVRADKVVAWIQNVTDRKIERLPCDLPTDDGGAGSERGTELSAGGCNAAGALHGGLVLVYGALVVVGLRRQRRRRASQVAAE